MLLYLHSEHSKPPSSCVSIDGASLTLDGLLELLEEKLPGPWLPAVLVKDEYYLVKSQRDTESLLEGKDTQSLKSLEEARKSAKKQTEAVALPTLIMESEPEVSPATTVPVFSLSSLLSGECSSLLVESMKSNGFFLLDLDGTSRNGGEIKRTGSVTAPVVPMFSAVKEFFGEPPEFKSQFALTDGRRVYGYKALPSLDKEYWKVRKSSSQLWPSEEMKNKCYTIMDCMHSITRICTNV